MSQITYKSVGVDYDLMDPFKRAAQNAGLETIENIKRLNFTEFGASRGESVYLIESATSYLAHVEEGLGTKNLVADAMHDLTGKTYYDHIAQDTIAMIVNDMITLGAMPLSVSMHLAVSDSRWFADEARYKDLINGWKDGCNIARCVWGCGETPTLKDIIMPGTAVLSGSAIGFMPKDQLILPSNIQCGDSIVFIESSGIHANGLTLARKIAESLKYGYLTPLKDGRTYGETILDATHIYVSLVEDCINCGVNIHYAVNITGHGWRKLMRPIQPFVYVIETLPKQLSIFDFLQKNGPVDDREAYANFNMGAGFALYVAEKDVEAIIRIAKFRGFNAVHAGHIEKAREEKKVVIIPKDIEYSSQALGVR